MSNAGRMVLVLLLAAGLAAAAWVVVQVVVSSDGIEPETVPLHGRRSLARCGFTGTARSRPD